MARDLESLHPDQGIFDPPPGDESVNILNQIFGVGWERMLYDGVVLNDDSAISVLALLLQYLNIVVLSAVVVMFTYMMAVGVVGSSHEGKPLGQRYHTLWVPFRGVTSTLFLMPLPWAGGFSVLQALMLLFTSFAIGLASSVWGVATEFAERHGGRLVAPEVRIVDTDYVNRMFKVLITREFFRLDEGWDVPPIPALKFIPDDSAYSGTNFLAGSDLTVDIRGDEPIPGYWAYDIPVPTEVRTGHSYGFGRMMVRCRDRNTHLCRRRAEAMDVLRVDLQKAAQQIVMQTRFGHREDGRVLGERFQSGDIKLALRKYITAINGINTDLFKDANEDQVRQMEAFGRLARSQGWVVAGSWYWNLSRFQDEVINELNASPRVDMADPDILSNSVLDTAAFNGLIKYVDDLLRLEGNELGSDLQIEVAEATDSDWISFAWEWLGAPLQTLSYVFIDSILGGADPIASIQSYGSGILNTANGLFAFYVAKKTLGGIIRGAGKSLPGRAAELFGAKAATEGGIGFFAGLFTILIPFAFILIIMGLALSFYIPAIPFVMWWMGVVGWFILTIEFLVAAPLWAAAHALPDGEGFAGDQGKRGYMLFLRIILMPTLMIVGLFTALILFLPLSFLLAGLFKLFMAGLTEGRVGLFGAFAIPFIVTVVMIITAHKVFGLVTWLPDNVLRWLGDSGISLGEQQDQSQTNLAVMAGFREITQAGGRATKELGRESPDSSPGSGTSGALQAGQAPSGSSSGGGSSPSGSSSGGAATGSNALHQAAGASSGSSSGNAATASNALQAGQAPPPAAKQTKSTN